MNEVLLSAAKALLITAAIPIGFSIGFFICAYILEVLKEKTPAQ